MGEERIKRIKEKYYQKTDFSQPRLLIEKLIEQRKLLMDQKAEEALNPILAKKEKKENFRN